MSYKEIMGVVRNTGDGWYFLDDAGHAPLGVASITNDSTYIYVNYDQPATLIHSFLCDTDETYPYIIGAGVNPTYAAMAVRNPSTGALIDPTTLTTADGNFWFRGYVTVDDSPTHTNTLVTLPGATASTLGTHTFRQIIPNGTVSAPTGTVTKFRVSFKGGPTGGFKITNAYIGPKSGTYGFSSATQLTFGGVSTAVIGPDATIMSDWVTQSWNKTDDLVVSYYRANGAVDAYYTPSSSFSTYFKMNVSDASDLSPTGYSELGGAGANIATIITKVECDGF